MDHIEKISESQLLELLTIFYKDVHLLIFRSGTTARHIFPNLNTDKFKKVDEIVYFNECIKKDLTLEETLTSKMQKSIELINNADIIFIDPFHTFEDSNVCLDKFIKNAKPNAFIFVHDCSPNNVAWIKRDYKEGPWHGVTYLAFLEKMTFFRKIL